MTPHAAFRVVGWNAGLLLLVALAAEIVFGGWLFGPNLGALAIPRDVRLQYDWRETRPQDGIAVYTRDRFGLRGANGPPSGIDLLALGGSTTDELYVDDGRTWTAVLERALSRAGHPLDVANAGINGQSSVGHLRAMEAWLSRLPGLRPGYVLFYIGINDTLLGSEDIDDRLAPDTAAARAMRRLRNNSALFALARTVWGAFRARDHRVIYRIDPPGPLVRTPPAVIDRSSYADRLRAYAGRLKALAAWSRRLGARPIFVTQTRGDSRLVGGVLLATGPEAARARAELGLFNQITLGVCDDVDGICIDLATELDLTPSDFIDPLHTHAGGSEKIGRYLAANLKDRL